MSWEHLTAFGYGLAVGLLVAIYFVLMAWLRRRELVAELDRLRRHLHDQMEVSQEGAAHRKEELERLRKENENLRVTVKAWQQKPNRQQLRSFIVYDRAIRQLMANAPSFGTHWESALQQAEAEVEQMDRGLLAFAKRLILPAKRDAPSAPAKEDEQE